MNNLKDILASKNIAGIYNYLESVRYYDLDQDKNFYNLWNHSLCDKNIVINYRDSNLDTIIHKSNGACFQYIKEFVTLSNFDLNTLNKYSENIAFRTANRPDIIHLYKELGLDINHLNHLGRNMLFYKDYNNIPVITEGLKAGVDATVISKDGYSLADFFSSRAYLPLFKKVCNKGSRLNKIDIKSLPEKHKIFYDKIKIKDVELEKKKILKSIKLNKPNNKKEKIIKNKRL